MQHRDVDEIGGVNFCFLEGHLVLVTIMPCNYRILHITQRGTHTTFDLLCQTGLKELLPQKLKSS